MSEVSRRDFVKLGMGATAGLASLRLSNRAAGLPAFAPQSLQHSPGILSGAFLVEMRRLSQINQETGGLFDVVNWQSPTYGSGPTTDLHSPLAYSLEGLEKWAIESCNLSDAATSEDMLAPPRSLPNPIAIPALAAPIVGLPNTYDLVGSVLSNLQSSAPVDLALDFFYDAQGEVSSYPLGETVLPATGLMANPQPVQIYTDLPLGAEGTGPIIAAPPSVTLYGWRLQFRGPETHPLGACVTQNVNHFHIELFRQSSSGRWDYVTNLHIGAYRSSGRRCFVLWNNYRPSVCWKVCSPTWDQLKEMLAWVVAAAAAIVGVVLAWWLISAIAAAATSILWVPLLALA